MADRTLGLVPLVDPAPQSHVPSADEKEGTREEADRFWSDVGALNEGEEVGQTPPEPTLPEKSETPPTTPEPPEHRDVEEPYEDEEDLARTYEERDPDWELDEGRDFEAPPQAHPFIDDPLADLAPEEDERPSTTSSHQDWADNLNNESAPNQEPLAAANEDIDQEPIKNLYITETHSGQIFHESHEPLSPDNRFETQKPGAHQRPSPHEDIAEPPSILHPDKPISHEFIEDEKREEAPSQATESLDSVQETRGVEQEPIQLPGLVDTPMGALSEDGEQTRDIIWKHREDTPGSIRDRNRSLQGKEKDAAPMPSIQNPDREGTSSRDDSPPSSELKQTPAPETGSADAPRSDGKKTRVEAAPQQTPSTASASQQSHGPSSATPVSQRKAEKPQGDREVHKPTQSSSPVPHPTSVGKPPSPISSEHTVDQLDYRDHGPQAQSVETDSFSLAPSTPVSQHKSEKPQRNDGSNPELHQSPQASSTPPLPVSVKKPDDLKSSSPKVDSVGSPERENLKPSTHSAPSSSHKRAQPNTNTSLPHGSSTLLSQHNEPPEIKSFNSPDAGSSPRSYQTTHSPSQEPGQGPSVQSKSPASLKSVSGNHKTARPAHRDEQDQGTAKLSGQPVVPSFQDITQDPATPVVIPPSSKPSTQLSGTPSPHSLEQPNLKTSDQRSQSTASPSDEAPLPLSEVPPLPTSSEPDSTGKRTSANDHSRKSTQRNPSVAESIHQKGEQPTPVPSAASTNPVEPQKVSPQTAQTRKKSGADLLNSSPKVGDPASGRQQKELTTQQQDRLSATRSQTTTDQRSQEQIEHYPSPPFTNVQKTQRTASPPADSIPLGNSESVAIPPISQKPFSPESRQQEGLASQPIPAVQDREAWERETAQPWEPNGPNVSTSGRESQSQTVQTKTPLLQANNRGGKPASEPVAQGKPVHRRLKMEANDPSGNHQTPAPLPRKSPKSHDAANPPVSPENHPTRSPSSHREQTAADPSLKKKITDHQISTEKSSEPAKNSSRSLLKEQRSETHTNPVEGKSRIRQSPPNDQRPVGNTSPEVSYRDNRLSEMSAQPSSRTSAPSNPDETSPTRQPTPGMEIQPEIRQGQSASQPTALQNHPLKKTPQQVASQPQVRPNANPRPAKTLEGDTKTTASPTPYNKLPREESAKPVQGRLPATTSNQSPEAGSEPLYSQELTGNDSPPQAPNPRIASKTSHEDQNAVPKKDAKASPPQWNSSLDYSTESSVENIEAPSQASLANTSPMVTPSPAEISELDSVSKLEASAFTRDSEQQLDQLGKTRPPQSPGQNQLEISSPQNGMEDTETRIDATNTPHDKQTAEPQDITSPSTEIPAPSQAGRVHKRSYPTSVPQGSSHPLERVSSQKADDQVFPVQSPISEPLGTLPRPRSEELRATRSTVAQPGIPSLPIGEKTKSQGERAAQQVDHSTSSHRPAAHQPTADSHEHQTSLQEKPSRNTSSPEVVIQPNAATERLPTAVPHGKPIASERTSLPQARNQNPTQDPSPEIRVPRHQPSATRPEAIPPDPAQTLRVDAKKTASPTASDAVYREENTKPVEDRQPGPGSHQDRVTDAEPLAKPQSKDFQALSKRPETKTTARVSQKDPKAIQHRESQTEAAHPHSPSSTPKVMNHQTSPQVLNTRAPLPPPGQISEPEFTAPQIDPSTATRNHQQRAVQTGKDGLHKEQQEKVEPPPQTTGNNQSQGLEARNSAVTPSSEWQTSAQEAGRKDIITSQPAVIDGDKGPTNSPPQRSTIPSETSLRRNAGKQKPPVNSSTPDAIPASHSQGLPSPSNSQNRSLAAQTTNASPQWKKEAAPQERSRLSPPTTSRNIDEPQPVSRRLDHREIKAAKAESLPGSDKNLANRRNDQESLQNQDYKPAQHENAITGARQEHHASQTTSKPKVVGNIPSEMKAPLGQKPGTRKDINLLKETALNNPQPKPSVTNEQHSHSQSPVSNTKGLVNKPPQPAAQSPGNHLKIEQPGNIKVAATTPGIGTRQTPFPASQPETRQERTDRTRSSGTRHTAPEKGDQNSKTLSPERLPNQSAPNSSRTFEQASLQSNKRHLPETKRRESERARQDSKIGFPPKRETEPTMGLSDPNHIQKSKVQKPVGRTSPPPATPPNDLLQSAHPRSADPGPQHLSPEPGQSPENERAYSQNNVQRKESSNSLGKPDIPNRNVQQSAHPQERQVSSLPGQRSGENSTNKVPITGPVSKERQAEAGHGLIHFEEDTTPTRRPLSSEPIQGQRKPPMASPTNARSSRTETRRDSGLKPGQSTEAPKNQENERSGLGKNRFPITANNGLPAVPTERQPSQQLPPLAKKTTPPEFQTRPDHSLNPAEATREKRAASSAPLHAETRKAGTRKEPRIQETADRVMNLHQPAISDAPAKITPAPSKREALQVTKQGKKDVPPEVNPRSSKIQNSSVPPQDHSGSEPLSDAFEAKAPVVSAPWQGQTPAQQQTEPKNPGAVKRSEKENHPRRKSEKSRQNPHQNPHGHHGIRKHKEGSHGPILPQKGTIPDLVPPSFLPQSKGSVSASPNTSPTGSPLQTKHNEFHSQDIRKEKGFDFRPDAIQFAQKNPELSQSLDAGYAEPSMASSRLTRPGSSSDRPSHPVYTQRGEEGTPSTQNRSALVPQTPGKPEMGRPATALRQDQTDGKVSHPPVRRQINHVSNQDIRQSEHIPPGSPVRNKTPGVSAHEPQNVEIRPAMPQARVRRKDGTFPEKATQQGSTGHAPPSLATAQKPPVFEHGQGSFIKDTRKEIPDRTPNPTSAGTKEALNKTHHPMVSPGQEHLGAPHMQDSRKGQAHDQTQPEKFREHHISQDLKQTQKDSRQPDKAVTPLTRQDPKTSLSSHPAVQSSAPTAQAIRQARSRPQAPIARDLRKGPTTREQPKGQTREQALVSQGLDKNIRVNQSLSVKHQAPHPAERTQTGSLPVRGQKASGNRKTMGDQSIIPARTGVKAQADAPTPGSQKAIKIHPPSEPGNLVRRPAAKVDGPSIGRSATTRSGDEVRLIRGSSNGGQTPTALPKHAQPSATLSPLEGETRSSVLRSRQQQTNSLNKPQQAAPSSLLLPVEKPLSSRVQDSRFPIRREDTPGSISPDGRTSIVRQKRRVLNPTRQSSSQNQTPPSTPRETVRQNVSTPQYPPQPGHDSVIRVQPAQNQSTAARPGNIQENPSLQPNQTHRKVARQKMVGKQLEKHEVEHSGHQMPVVQPVKKTSGQPLSETPAISKTISTSRQEARRKTAGMLAEKRAPENPHKQQRPVAQPAKVSSAQPLAEPPAILKATPPQDIPLLGTLQPAPLNSNSPKTSTNLPETGKTPNRPPSQNAEDPTLKRVSQTERRKTIRHGWQKVVGEDTANTHQPRSAPGPQAETKQTNPVMEPTPMRTLKPQKNHRENLFAFTRVSPPPTVIRPLPAIPDDAPEPSSPASTRPEKPGAISYKGWLGGAFPSTPAPLPSPTPAQFRSATPPSAQAIQRVAAPETIKNTTDQTTAQQGQITGRGLSPMTESPLEAAPTWESQASIPLFPRKKAKGEKPDRALRRSMARENPSDSLETAFTEAPVAMDSSAGFPGATANAHRNATRNERRAQQGNELSVKIGQVKVTAKKPPPKPRRERVYYMGPTKSLDEFLSEH